MRGDKVRRRQSTETLCCFTPPHPLCVCAANVVCLFTEWLDLAGRNVHSFPFLPRLLTCLSLWFFLHPRVSLLHLSLCPFCLSMCLLLLVHPLKNSRFNSEEVFWLITLGIFPPSPFAFERSSSAARSSSISACGAGESHANYPGYWLLQRRGCDLHEVTFSSNVQTFATFFWKTINSGCFLVCFPPRTLFFSTLHHSLSLFLWLLSSHKHRRFTAKRVRAVQGGETVGVFSVASGYLLVNWQLFFVVDIQRGVKLALAKVYTLLLQDCSWWKGCNDALNSWYDSWCWVHEWIFLWFL